MRVIAGSARGRTLKAPEGLGTRPMTDRTKGSVFNILSHMGFPQDGDRVLDLYAGTGSLGIEALSRGAAWCDFVEQNSKVVAIIHDNLVGTGFEAQGKVHSASVPTFLTRHGAWLKGDVASDEQTYDIIFLDPPYAAPDILDVLHGVAESGLLHKQGIVVLGHAVQVEPGDVASELVRIRNRVFGGSAFSLYRHPDAIGPADDEDEKSGDEPEDE